MMPPYRFKCIIKEKLADMDTPVSLYLKLRDYFPESMLLESSDHASMNSHFSFIAIQPLAGVSVRDGHLYLQYPDAKTGRVEVQETGLLAKHLNTYMKMFAIDPGPVSQVPTFGLFGYFGYDSVACFETVRLKHKDAQIPEIRLDLYRYVLVFNHMKNTLQMVAHIAEEEVFEGFDALERIMARPSVPAHPFELTGAEHSDMDDPDYLQMVEAGKHHCRLGNVFQIVLSRKFQQRFLGDEFMLYRHLRSLNPSPYLFYCDYGAFRLLGSSPEVQLKMKDGKAVIHPIAGTYKRTGNDDRDIQAAEKLLHDPKETAEHTMLVDLARNDLSRDFNRVEVKVNKALEFFSHVIHIVSEVEGGDARHPQASLFEIIGHSFPAGTLAGAPKYRAVQLIDQLEASGRGFYGGCIGFVGFDQSVNMAIMIRSFMSRGQVLTYRAGAGITAASVPEHELQEVAHKLGALRAALKQAGTESHQIMKS